MSDASSEGSPFETVAARPPQEPPVETPPLLRVVSGDPTPEELAALVAVIAAASSAGTPDAPAPRSEWSARHRLVRGPHRHGPGAWRASAR